MIDAKQKLNRVPDKKFHFHPRQDKMAVFILSSNSQIQEIVSFFPCVGQVFVMGKDKEERGFINQWIFLTPT